MSNYGLFCSLFLKMKAKIADADFLLYFTTVSILGQRYTKNIWIYSMRIYSFLMN